MICLLIKLGVEDTQVRQELRREREGMGEKDRERRSGIERHREGE